MSGVVAVGDVETFHTARGGVVANWCWIDTKNVVSYGALRALSKAPVALGKKMTRVHIREFLAI